MPVRTSEQKGDLSKVRLQNMGALQNNASIKIFFKQNKILLMTHLTQYSFLCLTIQLHLTTKQISQGVIKAICSQSCFLSLPCLTRSYQPCVSTHVVILPFLLPFTSSLPGSIPMDASSPRTARFSLLALLSQNHTILYEIAQWV